MAGQMLTIFSDTFKGGAIIAGGSFYCMQTNYLTYYDSCLQREYPLLPKSYTWQQIAGADLIHANKGIDDLSNLKNRYLYLFNGAKDSVVNPINGQ